MSDIVKQFELERLFADLVVLWWDTKLCHWNINGHQFSTLHPLFEAQYTELDQLADKLAEHIRALGFKVPGTLSEYQKLANLEKANPVASADEMVLALKNDYEKIHSDIQDVLSTAPHDHAVVTVDLLTQICSFSLHTAWVLGSNLPQH